MSISMVLIIVGILLAITLAVPLAQPAVQRERLTWKELKALSASAKTPADHERFAAYYRAEAQRLEAKHREHEESLSEYYKNPLRYSSKYPAIGDQYRNLAAYFKMAAGQAATLAEMHETVAREAQ